MKQNEHKRVKHGHLPGDLSHSTLVRMRESKEPIDVFPWQRIGRHAINAFRNILIQKGHKVQRRRDRAMIEEGLDDLE